MKVKRLKMQSFRGIGDLTLEFPTDEPIVLIGINGVGKSSILDCLAILISELQQWIFKYKKNPDSFYREKDIMKKRNKTRNSLTLQWNLREGEWYSKGELGEHNTLPKESYLEGNLGEVIEDFRNQFVDNFDANANLPLAIYYPVNRAVLDIPLETLEEEDSFKQVDAYKQALDGVQINFGSFFQWFRNREDLESELLRDNRDYKDQQLEAVRQSIASLLPDFSNLRVRRSPLRMTVTKQGQELIVNQLSDGEKCLLAMVGDLARRLAIANPSLPEPLEGSGVVMIDEIELHLHPKWQREIIPALTRTFPNCQFIVTTHSPQVISDVKPESVYILEATQEGIVAKRPDSSFGRDSNYILEVLMGTPARKEEIKDDLLELFRLIDRGNIDSAKQLRQQIADKIGADEPELVKANVLLRRKEILNR